jgi:hypothetical protein
VRADLREGLRVLGEMGFDPQVGRKLYHWCWSAGLRDINVSVAPYQMYAGGLPERDLMNWRKKLSIAADYLIEHTGHRERWERLRHALLAQLRSPDLFYYCSLVTVWGKVTTT